MRCLYNFSISMSSGSCALGVLFGLLTVQGLRALYRPLAQDDPILQIALTLCCGYLSFYFAQELCDISGILCCCSAGLMLSWLAPPIILNHESMHNVWSVIEWLGNSLIFLLAGIYIHIYIYIYIHSLICIYTHTHTYIYIYI